MTQTALSFQHDDPPCQFAFIWSSGKRNIVVSLEWACELRPDSLTVARFCLELLEFPRSQEAPEL